MNGFEITMLSTILGLGGVLSGLGFCFKYKKHLLLKTSSQDQLSELLTTIMSVLKLGIQLIMDHL